MKTKFFLCVLCVFVASLFSQRQPLPDEKGLLPEAEKKLAADPKNIELLLALGKTQGDLWRFDEAIATYTRGMALAPDHPLLYLNRGHRYISTRRFDLALADLEKGASIDPNISEVWYHLALAHYMKGDFAKAAPAWERCRDLAKTDDNLASSSDWLYMTYRRLRREKEAAQVLERISPEMKISASSPYYHQRLLFYKGLKKEEELFGKDLTDVGVATLQYGVGNWHLYNGNVQKAREYFERVVAGKGWAAFAFIAAEAELKLKPMPPNAPKDQPVDATGKAQVEEYRAAIAPYVERARRTYPGAKKRYLDGLPPGHGFSAVTSLRDGTGTGEQVFVAVTGIRNGRISGRIASDILGVSGHKYGDAYSFPESELIDWVISRPDGTEEGNVVGKFLDEWQKTRRPR